MFELGDKVVYPHHGAGTVVQKETKNVLGEAGVVSELEARDPEDDGGDYAADEDHAVPDPTRTPRA